LNALIGEYQRAFGLGLEEVAAGPGAVVRLAIGVLPALSFIRLLAPDVAPLDPLLLEAVTATLSAAPTSVTDSNDVWVVAEEIVAPACAAAARIPSAKRSRNRRRKDATLPVLACDGRQSSDPPAASYGT
jgi:hypothetical protein